MGPQYDPKRVFNDSYCLDSWLCVSQECLHQLGAQLLSPGCSAGHGARGQIRAARPLAYGSVAPNLSCMAHDRVRVKS